MVDSGGKKKGSEGREGEKGFTFVLYRSSDQVRSGQVRTMGGQLYWEERAGGRRGRKKEGQGEKEWEGGRERRRF